MAGIWRLEQCFHSRRGQKNVNHTITPHFFWRLDQPERGHPSTVPPEKPYLNISLSDMKWNDDHEHFSILFMMAYMYNYVYTNLTCLHFTYPTRNSHLTVHLTLRWCVDFPHPQYSTFYINLDKLNTSPTWKNRQVWDTYPQSSSHHSIDVATFHLHWLVQNWIPSSWITTNSNYPQLI